MTAIERLAALERSCTSSAALAFFDSLAGVRVEQLFGRWKGRELSSGHPMDGALAASGWYGKQFDDAETVHPLLMKDRDGELYAMEPRRVPFGTVARTPRGLIATGRKLLGAMPSLVRTTRPRARLRHLEHRGLVTAAMIYDHLPIIDVFRQIDERTMLGLMDVRRQIQPYFFVLSRD